MAGIEQRLGALEPVGHVHQHLGGIGREVGLTEFQRVFAALLRSHLQVGHTARLHDPAVGDQFPRQFVIVQSDEEVLVVDRNAALRQIDRLGPDGLVLALHLVGVRVVGPVGGDHAVVVERVVGGVVVVEVAAVVERHAAVGLIVGQRLIDVVPDEAALVGRILAHKVPVEVETAHRVAHRVSVLALDQRLPGIRLAVVLAGLVIPVHRADDVRVGTALVLLVVDRTLVVHRTRRIVILDPFVALLEVGAHAGLVAHRPDDHRRVVLVAQHHAHVALEVRLGEERVGGQRPVAVTHAV